MIRIALFLPLLFVTTIAAPAQKTDGPGSSGAPDDAKLGYHVVKLNGHTFTLPTGFTIELAAAPPLADRPIVAALDEKGRLYVCDSSGSNEKVTEQIVKKPHRIMRLEDTDGDGKYDKSTVFVSNVMFPEGAMWMNGSLYVAAPPEIWKFTDTDDDGKADKEEVWFDGKKVAERIGGCANDLHGPYRGPDGWVYWCKGGFEKQQYTLPNGKQFNTRTSHIFRAKPDGSNIEPVMTGGMDNPVDCVFTPAGDRIFSCTFLQHPGGGKRDGLIHAVYGAVYGKDHAGTYEHPWTAPTHMPPMTHLGPAAPCGLHRYESDQCGNDFENNIFCCQFNMRKVSRHVLVPSGSTYITKDFDFVVSDQQDFHPTDVIEDADGSLLIIDTGGWYKLCCPSSQLVKPDVKGAIYRVKKIGAHKVDDPRGLKIDWKVKTEDLIGYLDDARPVVREKAIATIAVRGKEAVPLLADIFTRNRPSERIQLAAAWAAARLNDPAAMMQVFDMLRLTGNTTVHSVALHAISLRRPDGATELLLRYVQRYGYGGSPQARRVAAEALGRIGDAKAIPAILDALADETNDRTLDHALTYALIEIGDREQVLIGTENKSPRVRRACLTALDQMPNGKLDAELVISRLGSPDAALNETAWWIAGRHPQWGEHLVGYFREQLKKADKLSPEARSTLTDQLVKFLKNPAVQPVVAEGAKSGVKEAQVISLRGMARSGLKEMPEAWAKAVLRAADTGDPAVIREALAAVRTVSMDANHYNQLGIALAQAQPPITEETHLAYLAAAPPGFALADADLKYLVVKFASGDASADRARVADVLGRRGLSAKQLVVVALLVRNGSPLDIARLLPVFEKSKEEPVGLALLDALSQPKVRGVVRIEQVKPILDKYPKSVQAEAEKLYALLAEARKEERGKLEKLLADMPAGDIRRGQTVFNGSKAQCAACHKIGYVGGVVGPDLTRIGSIRTERDLLESIVFPSASFVRSYEPVRVTTGDGRVLNGILKTDAPDEIVLTIAADKEERIARSNVEDISPGSVSVMPAGLDQQLTVQELADLVAFLRACR